MTNRLPISGALLLSALAAIAQPDGSAGNPKQGEQQGASGGQTSGKSSGQDGKTEFPEQLPQHVPSLQMMAMRAMQEQQYREFVRILSEALKLHPFDDRIMAQLVAGYSLLDQNSKAYNMMLYMQRQGLAFDFDKLPQTENIRGTQSYEFINDMLKRADEHVGQSQKAFELPKDIILPETLEWDPVNEQFLVGTVHGGKIARFSRDGQRLEAGPKFDTGEAWSVFDLDVDAQRGHLWASTTAVGQYVDYKQSLYGKAALLRYDLESGELQQRYELKPDGERHGWGNLAVASDGTVYIADIRSPYLYVLEPGANGPRKLLNNPYLANTRGLAVDNERGLLYVADRNLGINFVDLNKEKLYRIGTAQLINLGGIDGLDFWNDHLVMVQNGIRPSRVMLLRLSDDGRRIEAQQALEVSNPHFDGPTYGAVVGDVYYYLAANQWPAFDTNGNRRPGTSLDPVPVLRVPLEPVPADAGQPPDVPSALERGAQPGNQAPGSLEQGDAAIPHEPPEAEPIEDGADG